MRSCPECGLRNSRDEEFCECGYDFGQKKNDSLNETPVSAAHKITIMQYIKIFICTISLILFFIVLLVFVSGIILTKAESTYISKDKPVEIDKKRSLYFIDELANRKSNDLYTTELLLSNTINNEKYSIYSFSINKNAKYRVLLTGSVHGEEPGGAYSLAEFIKNAKFYMDKYPDICFDVIPVLNPWGFENYSRFNNEGINIGVDFSNKKSKEAKAISNYLKGKKFDLVIDFHENSNPSNFIIVHSKKRISKTKLLIDKLIKENIQIADSPTMSFVKSFSNENGISYYPWITSLFEKLASRETLFVMLINKNQANEVYCFETEHSDDIDNKIQINKEVIEYYADNIRNTNVSIENFSVKYSISNLSNIGLKN